MVAFAIVSDDQHRAFINYDAITVVRVKIGESGQLPDGDENVQVEIDFIGGSTHRLSGETARDFIQSLKGFQIRNH